MMGSETGWGWQKRERGVGSRRMLRMEVIVLVLVLLCLVIFGPGMLEDMSEESLGERFASSSPGHPWGTDHLGRDMFVRVAVSAGTTGVTLLALWIIAFVGGTAAGIVRGLVPSGLQPLIDALYRAWDCFPMILLAAALVILNGSARPVVIVVLAAMGSVVVSRRVGEAMIAVARHSSHQAAIATCVSARNLWTHYRLPHALHAGVHASWAFLASALIWETSLAFVSPATAISPWSLGNLMREGSSYLMDAPGLVLLPAAALFAIRLVILIFETASVRELERFRYLLVNEDR